MHLPSTLKLLDGFVISPLASLLLHRSIAYRAADAARHLFGENLFPDPFARLQRGVLQSNPSHPSGQEHVSGARQLPPFEHR